MLRLLVLMICSMLLSRSVNIFAAAYLNSLLPVYVFLDIQKLYLLFIFGSCSPPMVYNVNVFCLVFRVNISQRVYSFSTGYLFGLLHMCRSLSDFYYKYTFFGNFCFDVFR